MGGSPVMTIRDLPPTPEDQRRSALIIRVASIGSILTIAIGIFGTGFILLWPRIQTPTAATLEAPAPRTTIAIVAMENTAKNPELDWIGLALTEALTAELRRSGRIRVVSVPQVDEGAANAAEIEGALLQATTGKPVSEHLIIGSYLATGQTENSRLELVLQLAGASPGDTGSRIVASNQLSRFGRVAHEAASSLLKALTGTEIDNFEDPASSDLISHRLAAMRHYSRGVGHLRRFEPAAARLRLEQAVEADPKFPLAHAALSRSLVQLGYEQQAVVHARRAVALADNLPREDRLLIEAWYHEARKEWQSAAAIYSRLARAYPDDPEYRLRLAEVLISNNEGANALQLLETLTTGEYDMRVPLLRAEAYRVLSDYTELRKTAERAEQVGRQQQGYIYLGRALSLKGIAQFHLGERAAAEMTFQEAQRIFQSNGDSSGYARATVRFGTLLASHGELAPALERFEQALAAGRQVGDRSVESAALTNLGYILVEQGRLTEAAVRVTEASAVFQAISDPHGQALAIDHLGFIHYLQADLPRAEELFRQSIDLAESANHEATVGLATFNLADVLLARGQLREALQHHRKGREKRAGAGDHRGVIESDLSIATVRFHLGQFPSAVSTANQVAVTARAAGHADLEALAYCLLAEIALEAADPDAAREALSRAAASAGSATRLTVRLRLDALELLANSSTGPLRESIRRLERVADRADAAGMQLLSLPMRLEAARLERRLDSDAASRKLTTLRDRARQLDYTLVERRASSSL
jgi:eukaryotic-like serine/threonine-protein kinase